MNDEGRRAADPSGFDRIGIPARRVPIDSAIAKEEGEGTRGRGVKERGQISRKMRSDSRSRTSFRASRIPRNAAMRIRRLCSGEWVATDGENELPMSIETTAFLLSFDFWLPVDPPVESHPFKTPRVLLLLYLFITTALCLAALRSVSRDHSNRSLRLGSSC